MEKIIWQIQTKKISSLKAHPKNPRILTKEQEHHITESLEKFGIVEKPIINTDGTIIGGHQRLKVLKKLKAKDIDCWVPSRDLTDQEVDELNIRLNRNVGDWDWECLANEWETDDLLNWGFTLEQIGLESAEIVSDPEKKDKKKECPQCGHRF